MAEQIHTALTILRRRQVEARVGLRRSTLYQRIAEQTFPAPIRIGRRAVGWLLSDVEDWLRARVAESRGGVK
jgi:prophage regulatory protein